MVAELVAERVAPIGIVSDSWIAETRIEQRALNEQLTLIKGQQAASLHVVRTLDIAANVSYARKSLAWGKEIGSTMKLREFDNDDDAIRCIRDELGPDPNVDSILALLPPWTPDGEKGIRLVMPPEKDVDGSTLQAKPLWTAATAESMRICAERIGGAPLKKLGRIGVIGNGARTLAPLVEEVFPDAEVTAGFHLKTGEEIKAFNEHDEGVEEAMACDTLFIAVPIGGILTRDRVRDGQIIVDVGYGMNERTGRPTGNVDPLVFIDPSLKRVKATSFRNCGGPVTSAITHGRGIDIRLAKAGVTKVELLTRAAEAAYEARLMKRFALLAMLATRSSVQPAYS